MTPDFIDDIVFAVNSSNIRSRFREGIDIYGSWDTDVKVSDFIFENSNDRAAVFPLTHGYFQIFLREYAKDSAYITFSYTVPSLGRYNKVLHGDAISRSVKLRADDCKNSAKIRKILIKKLNSLADAACEFHSNRVENLNNVINYKPSSSLNYVISALAKVKVAVANSKLRFDALNYDDDMLQELNSEVDRLQEMVLNEIRSDPNKYMQAVRINIF